MLKPSATPVFLQSKPGESGAICLAMLLGNYRSFPTLTDVKNSCDCGNDEIEPAHLLTACLRFGFKADILTLPFDKLIRQSVPLILPTTSGKFLLLVKKTGNRFIVHDPEAGRRKVTKEELKDEFSGQVLMVKPGPDFVIVGSQFSFISEIITRISPYKGAVAYVLIAGLILLIPAIVIPALSKIFFDDIIIQGQNLWFKPMLSLMAGFLVLGCILVYMQQWILLRAELKMSLVDSAKFVSHILRIPYTYFQSHPPGDTVKRIKLNDSIATMLSRDMTQLIISLTTVFFYGIVMIKYNLLLTITGVSIMLLNIIALKYFSAKRTALNQSLFQKQQRTFSTASVGIQHIETLKASGWENDFFTLWSSYLITSINDEQKLGLTSRMLTVFPDVLSQMSNVIIVLLGGLLIIVGEISLGVFIAMQSFIANFAEPIKNVANIIGDVQLNKSNLNNLRDSLDEPVDPLCKQDGRLSIDAITPFNARLSGKLEVNNITFGYSKFSRPLIENFSMSAFPGKRIALVGPSGCGKSTILKVIAGLYASTSGEILYDDMNINSVNSDVLRNSLAIVDQDIFLFTGTVSDNIIMWNRAIEPETVIEAAKDAVIHDVITEREGGYQAKMAPGGGNFSGGERQRLEIARALVTNAAIIFLDEATSALDAETEKIVMENIRKRKCTTITIAHRMSTIKDYDEIIVIDSGKVIQRGTHDELVMQKDKLYYTLISES